MSVDTGSSISQSVSEGGGNLKGTDRAELARQRTKGCRFSKDTQARLDQSMAFLEEWGISLGADNDDHEPRNEAA